MKSIQLPRAELHLIPKKDLETYKASKWMKTIEKEGIKIPNCKATLIMLANHKIWMEKLEKMNFCFADLHWLHI